MDKQRASPKIPTFQIGHLLNGWVLKSQSVKINMSNIGSSIFPNEIEKLGEIVQTLLNNLEHCGDHYNLSSEIVIKNSFGEKNGLLEEKRLSFSGKITHPQKPTAKKKTKPRHRPAAHTIRQCGSHNAHHGLDHLRRTFFEPIKSKDSIRSIRSIRFKLNFLFDLFCVNFCWQCFWGKYIE